MSLKKTNLSEEKTFSVHGTAKMRIGILVSEWNEEVTSALLTGTTTTLQRHGVKKSNVFVKYVPGSFELTAGASMMADALKLDAIICLGCIIQGETRHFEFIAQAVANGITHVGIQYNIPVVFGVLTTDNYQQALDRCGGKHGNKGDEAAVTAIKMVDLRWNLTA
jgi:6,7-dimethyl-8-ribityllumazine synthase